MKTLTAIALALLVSGCAETIGPFLAAVGADPNKAVEVEAKTVRTLMKPIRPYCVGAPETMRARLRDAFNAELAGDAEIGIWCAGDQPLTLGQ